STFLLTSVTAVFAFSKYACTSEMFKGTSSKLPFTMKICSSASSILASISAEYQEYFPYVSYDLFDQAFFLIVLLVFLLHFRHYVSFSNDHYIADVLVQYVQVHFGFLSFVLQ